MSNLQIWKVGIIYAVNAQVTYQGAVYRCLQAHKSYPDWAPPLAPSLWKPAVPPATAAPLSTQSMYGMTYH